MDTTLTLIDLAGSVALLLWGVHMLQSGIQAAERHRARLLDLLNRALAPHQDDWTRQALGASRAPWLHRQGADARRELGCAEPHGELHLLSKVREWPEYDLRHAQSAHGFRPQHHAVGSAGNPERPSRNRRRHGRS